MRINQYFAGISIGLFSIPGTSADLVQRFHAVLVHPCGHLVGTGLHGAGIGKVCGTHLHRCGTGHDELQCVTAGGNAAQTHHRDVHRTHGLPYHAQGDGAHRRAGQTGKRAIFTERVDNVMTLKRFAIHPGEKCLIAEDVVTTGISSLETKRVIEENGGICVGITCVVDRTKPEAPSPIPIVASALKLDLPNYAPEECPICKEGKLPLVHLGSRKMKQEAKQTL